MSTRVKIFKVIGIIILIPIVGFIFQHIYEIGMHLGTYMRILANFRCF